MAASTIPFVDVAADWSELKVDALARIAQVFEHGQFIAGPEVGELEARLAVEVGVRHAIACSSGTTALLIALMGLGVEAGDEIILPAFTFAAPLECVLLAGAVPVLADVDPATCLIDVEAVSTLIGPKTRAVIGVCLYGQPADFGRLRVLGAQRGIAVIEDAAQSYGATLAGKPSGGLATIGCTSFYPTKPLGAAGDGGALFTDDDALAARSREIRDHGQAGKYNHIRLGLNGRLGSIASAALLARLGSTKQAVSRRKLAAQRYDALLEEVARDRRLLLPSLLATASSAFAHYAVQVGRRDQVMEAMLRAGVQVAVHYPAPLHHQPAYRGRVSFRSLATSEAVASRVLCLPIYPTLLPEQQERVVSILIEALSGRGD